MRKLSSGVTTLLINFLWMGPQWFRFFTSPNGINNFALWQIPTHRGTWKKEYPEEHLVFSMAPSGAFGQGMCLSSLTQCPRLGCVGQSSRLGLASAVHVCQVASGCVWLFATPCTVAHLAPLSKENSRWEYRSRLPCPPPRDLPNPGIEPVSLTSLALLLLVLTSGILVFQIPLFPPR